MKTLFPKPTIPYCIASPPYTLISSGVQTLHLLCHALNSVGQRAFIMPYGEDRIPTVNPDLLTPLISSCFYEGEPIVVYPDQVVGNPVGAKHVVRYMLSRPELVAPWNPAPTDKIWSNTSGVARILGCGDNILTIPCTDRRIFYPPSNGSVRKGSCYYSHKYDKIAKNELLDVTKDSIRLEGPPQLIAEILRNSEVCYVYEMSNIIFDATLCGCPVVLIRSKYFPEMPGDMDWKMYGIKWNDEDLPINPEIDWMDKLNEEYDKMIEIFWMQLDKFIKETQNV